MPVGDLWIAKIWSIEVSVTLCYVSTIEIMLDSYMLSEKFNTELSFIFSQVWVSPLLFYPLKQTKKGNNNATEAGCFHWMRSGFWSLLC